MCPKNSNQVRVETHPNCNEEIVECTCRMETYEAIVSGHSFSSGLIYCPVIQGRGYSKFVIPGPRYSFSITSQAQAILRLWGNGPQFALSRHFSMGVIVFTPRVDHYAFKTGIASSIMWTHAQSTCPTSPSGTNYGILFLLLIRSTIFSRSLPVESCAHQVIQKKFLIVLSSEFMDTNRWEYKVTLVP